MIDMAVPKTPSIQTALTIFCADIGSIRAGNFGWSRGTVSLGGEWQLDLTVDGTDIQAFADRIANDLNDGLAVAVGFECPLFVPVSDDPVGLTKGRKGEGSRPWSAGAGAGALATGLTEVVWILREIRKNVAPEAKAYLDWHEFQASGCGLFLWEAFISGRAKGTSHTADAEIGVQTFAATLPDPSIHNAIDEACVHSLIGAAVLRTGWSKDLGLLEKGCLVIKA